MDLPAALLSARNHYHTLLKGAVLEKTRVWIERTVAHFGVQGEGPNVSRILRPCLITSDTYTDAQVRACAVSAALEAIFLAARNDESLRRALGIPTWQDPLFYLEAESVAPIVGRLDGLLERGTELRFLEYNPTPGGVYAVHAFGQIFSGTPAFEEFARRHPLQRPDTLEAALQALVTDRAERGRVGIPRLGVYGWNESTNLEEVERLAAVLHRRGLDIVRLTAEGPWELRGERLWFGELDVNLILFLEPTLFGSFLQAYGLDHPMMRGLAYGACHYFGGLARTLFFMSKRVFAALSDPRFSHLVPPDVSGIVARSIPWTRIVSEGRTSHGADDVDLIPFVAAHRQMLVLKPPYGFGGTDVVLGWRTSPEAWNRTVHRAIEEAWIVQERVFAPSDIFPMWRDGQLVYEELFWDLDPYVWNGKTCEGCLVRVGADPLLNTSAWSGSTTGLFVLKGA